MALINKQDTNGTKSTLAKGELGYDDYSAGGDKGRIYVGDGTNNIPIAKKSETDTLTTNLTNHVGSNGSAHSLVTGSANGFMSSTDKTKLDGLSQYVLPANVVTNTNYATSTVGGVIKARISGNNLYLTIDGSNA
jgi:hypothetical protein